MAKPRQSNRNRSQFALGIQKSACNALTKTTSSLWSNRRSESQCDAVFEELTLCRERRKRDQVKSQLPLASAQQSGPQKFRMRCASRGYATRAVVPRSQTGRGDRSCAVAAPTGKSIFEAQQDQVLTLLLLRQLQSRVRLNQPVP